MGPSVPVDSHARSNTGRKNSSSYLPVQQQELNYVDVVTIRNSVLKDRSNDRILT